MKDILPDNELENDFNCIHIHIFDGEKLSSLVTTGASAAMLVLGFAPLHLQDADFNWLYPCQLKKVGIDMLRGTKKMGITIL